MSEEIKVTAASLPEEAAVSTEKSETKKPLATLLGSITYDDEKAYQKFLENLTIQHSVLVLMSAANYAQTKGIFNLAEAELIAKSIKRLKTEATEKPNQPPNPANT